MRFGGAVIRQSAGTDICPFCFRISRSTDKLSYETLSVCDLLCLKYQIALHPEGRSVKDPEAEVILRKQLD